MDKLERLVNLVALLAESTRPMTAAELMATVPGYEIGGESARRTFERDKDTLRELGVEMETTPLDPLPGGDHPRAGYSLRKGRELLADPGLTLAERSALVLASAVAGGQGGPLGGSISVTREGDTAPVVLAEAVPPVLLETFMTAVSERRRVSMTYMSPGPPAQVKQRELCPYGLARRRGHWYVVGEDSLSGEVRSFRLDRIVGETEVGASGAFSRPQRFSALEAVPERGWTAGEGPATVVSVAVDPDWSWWVIPQAGECRQGPPVDVAGSVDGAQWPTILIEVRNTDAFCSWILSLLDTVVVTDPPRLRGEIVARLDDLVGES